MAAFSRSTKDLETSEKRNASNSTNISISKTETLFKLARLFKCMPFFVKLNISLKVRYSSIVCSIMINKSNKRKAQNAIRNNAATL
jgi:hypothetical protein